MNDLQRESRVLEYKRELNDLNKLARTVVAFANGDGGQIIVGIEDGSKKVVGCSADVIDMMLEKVPVSIADSIQPPIFPQVFEKTINGKEVLIIQVFPGSQKPYFIASEGMERGVYVRVGAHTRRAEGEILEELRLLRSRIGYDEAPVSECSIAELLLKLLPKSLQHEQALLSLSILRRDTFSQALHPTRGGILMLHETPEKFVPEANIIVSRMRGVQGRDTIESHEICGPLSRQSDVAMALLEEWLAMNPEVNGARQSHSKYRLPLKAIREALNNALLHRQYNVAGPVKIALYADRLEIFSPGHFAGPFSQESLGDGASYIRNRVICLVARRIGLIEKRGTGINLIKESMTQAGLVAPEFVEGTCWFKVSLFFDKLPNKKESPTDKILSLFINRGEIKSLDIAKLLNVSKVTAVSYISDLVASGRLLKIGNGPNSRYRISGV